MSAADYPSQQISDALRATGKARLPVASSQDERASGAWCAPRPPVPHSCPWSLSAEAEQAILDARAKTNWGPMQLTALTGRHRSTCWRVLRRHGVSRRRRGQPRQTTRRYEWAEAGALLHIDAFSAPKFDRPGHWATGQRAEEHKTRDAGKTVVIGVIDDHSRLAYCELHAAENAENVSATLRRAAAWMRQQGCGPVEAVMSDNAKCYSRRHAFRDLLTDLGAKHILIPPYTPRWNGKIERFFGTLDQESAHGRIWPNSNQRDRALSSFLRFYNRQRPHTAASGRPPITRVQQDRRQDTTRRPPGFLDVNTFADDVLIRGTGVDLGGPGYSAGSPTSSAFVSWPLDNGLVTPHYDGFIHVEGFSNCARTQMRVIGPAPLSLVLETVNGPKHCPADLDHESFHDILDATPTGSVNRVEIVLQTKNGGSWLDVDDQSVSIAN